MATIADSDGRISLDVEDDEAVFIRRDKLIQANGRVLVSVGIPAPLNAVIARVVNSCYLMQRISSNMDGGSITVTCPGGKGLLVVTLSENERSVVSFSHVVGFSDGLRLTTFANLSVAAFACDRNFATIAEGPGTLLIETNGNHVIHREGPIVVDPDQLVAWDPNTAFHLDRVHSLTDLYLNRVRVSCFLSGGMLPLVVDSVPRKESSAVNPLLAFLKSVYWPRLH